MMRFEDAAWFKAEESGGGDGNCVETAFVDEGVAVRHSKDVDGPVLLFSPGEWSAFVAGAKRGRFDLP